MLNEDKYILATADIDGEEITFYRNGKIEDFYTYKTYTKSDVSSLIKWIEANMHLIRHKFDLGGYFFSDDKLPFCQLYYPEIISEILKRKFNYNTNYGWEKSDFIIFTDKIDGYKAKQLFKKHFYK